MNILELQRKLRPVLGPLGAAYAAGMRAREALYVRGVFRRWQPQVPAVSVGNISMGGSGKTPVARFLLDFAAKKGLSAVLLTRGYGAKPPCLPYVVEPGSPAAEAGDEPLLLARSCPQAWVVVDPVRARSGPFAEGRFSPDMFVLDDAFQHLAAGRHVNLVLFRPEDLAEEWDAVFPAGTWREGAAALKRADAFLLKTDADRFSSLEPRIRERLERFAKPVFSFSLAPSGLVSLETGEEAEGTAPYVLATGIAHPEQAAVTATELIRELPRDMITFPDHHAFTQGDVRMISERAKKAGARRVVVTLKDAVKLAGLECRNFYVMDVRAVFGPRMADVGFTEWIERQISRISG